VKVDCHLLAHRFAEDFLTLALAAPRSRLTSGWGSKAKTKTKKKKKKKKNKKNKKNKKTRTTRTTTVEAMKQGGLDLSLGPEQCQLQGGG